MLADLISDFKSLKPTLNRPTPLTAGERKTAAQPFDLAFPSSADLFLGGWLGWPEERWPHSHPEPPWGCSHAN